MRLRCVACCAVMLFGCAPGKPLSDLRELVSRESHDLSDAEYPGTTAPPETLKPDFMVEQHVEAQRGDRKGSFDAVVQKQGDELLVVGLGPMKTRAFVLRQKGLLVTYQQSFGPPLPFPARNIVVDVHRVFFKRLPRAPSAGDGTFEGEVDGERVLEVWRDSQLRERRFYRPGEQVGAVKVEFGEGCRADTCQPDRVRIENEWFHYRIDITNTLYQAL